jgi:sterol 3beta-glucosyltransferase
MTTKTGAKIALATHGTRGDVQPFVSLALALMARGHEVTLGTPVNLMAFVESCGVPARKLAINSQAFMESPQGQEWLNAGNVQKFMKEMAAIVHDHRDELIADMEDVCAGADVVVTGLLTEEFLSVLAESRKLPMLSVHFNPMRPNSRYANGLVSVRALPGFLNRATHKLAEMAWWAGYKKDVNYFRQKVGLPPTNTPTPRRFLEHGWPTLHAFSPALVPPPAEYKDAMPVVGAIRFPQSARKKVGDTAHDPDLVAWLAAGSAPVFFGMGSMPVRDIASTLAIIAAASKACGVRALIGAGWSRMNEAMSLPDHLRIVGAVDHSWLLPQCRAAVHHGGAGTVQAAIVAGLPAVVASVFADQPFWGAQLERLGLGVHLPFKTFREDTLRAALTRVLAADVAANAKRVSAIVNAEPDGMIEIVRRIEALIPRS